uniref:Isochorismatase-like domain-containing protein n=1 Tax=Kalanchoe fedtschenkoi TaxID=63787 RepID=A0A7N1A2R1_KALFE
MGQFSLFQTTQIGFRSPIERNFIFSLLGTAKLVKAVVSNVVKAVEVCRNHGCLVVWVVREHDPLGRDVELFRRHFYAPGKIGPTAKGSVGADLVEGLVIEEGDYKLVKTRFSAFFNTHLHSVLQGLGIDSLVVAGELTPTTDPISLFLRAKK